MSGKKKITVPEPLKLGPNQEEYRLGHLVRFVLDNHPVYTSSGAGIRAGVRVENAFGIDAPVEEWPEFVELLEDDWKQLHNAVENPPPVACASCGQALGFGGYPVRPASKLLSLIDAIAEAEKS
jgi:hypothetical protein